MSSPGRFGQTSRRLLFFVTLAIFTVAVIFVEIGIYTLNLIFDFVGSRLAVVVFVLNVHANSP
jgi:hypothetical protein